MSSWGAIPALSGWNYNGIERALELKPRVRRNRFESFWSTASGWGTFSQTIGARNSVTLKVSEGGIGLRSLDVAWPGVKRVTLNGTEVPFHLEQGRVQFDAEINVPAGATMSAQS
jgi:hypothetical protein